MSTNAEDLQQWDWEGKLGSAPACSHRCRKSFASLVLLPGASTVPLIPLPPA